MPCWVGALDQAARIQQTRFFGVYISGMRLEASRMMLGRALNTTLQRSAAFHYAGLPRLTRVRLRG